MADIGEMRGIFIASVLLLGACTNEQDRSVYLNTLVGQPETVLLRQLGVPTRTFDSGGHKFLAYEEQHASEVYGGGFGGGFGSGFGVGFGSGFYGRGFGGYYSSLPGEIVARRCETTFELANDKVLTWALRGNACG